MSGGLVVVGHPGSFDPGKQGARVGVLTHPGAGDPG